MSQDPASNPNPEPTPTPPTPPAAPIDYQASGYAGPAPDKESKMWAMLAHISGLIVGFVGMPFLGPLIIWLMKKNEMPFVDDQGKEALNFHITLMIAFIIILPTFCIGIGFLLAPIVGIAAIIMSIIAGMKANEGIAYRYPFTLRLVK